MKHIPIQLLPLCVMAGFFVFSARQDQMGHPGKNEVLIRGCTQHVYCFPAIELRKSVLIEAKNHRFDGNLEEFLKQLLGELRCIEGVK